MFLTTAENTYNELLLNINKFEDIDDFLKECGYIYDSVIYYICHNLELECDDERFRYLDKCITDELSWDNVYDNIHNLGE